MSGVIVVTSPEVPGYRIERVLGLVIGSSVRTRGVGGRIIAGFEAIIGGRGEAYRKELDKARNEAIEELIEKTLRLGGNAVISVDFETTEVLEGFIVVTAYGTAVKVTPATP